MSKRKFWKLINEWYERRQKKKINKSYADLAFGWVKRVERRRKVNKLACAQRRINRKH